MIIIEYSVFISWGIGIFLFIKTILNIYSGKAGSNSLQLRWEGTRRDQQPFSFWFIILIQLLGAVGTIYVGFAVTDWARTKPEIILNVLTAKPTPSTTWTLFRF
ncbi:MAG: hypothetical protein ACJZ70_02560 [Limisphaerales bacterium]